MEQQRYRIGVHPMQIVEQQEQGAPGAEAAQESEGLLLQLHSVQTCRQAFAVFHLSAQRCQPIWITFHGGADPGQ